MGAGIAQLACAAGARTLVHDPDADALERGLAGIAQAARARGREGARSRRRAAGRSRRRRRSASSPTPSVVIEAAPESLELKRELFGQLSPRSCARTACSPPTPPRCSVTEIAAGRAGPRARGRHALLQPGAGHEARRGGRGRALGRGGARDARASSGRAMGRRVIDAADGPGFLVNRCGRPFGARGAAARAGGAGDARAGRPRLPPRRRLPDGAVRADGPRRRRRRLRGLEVASTSQSFGEPRWRPSMLAARKVAVGQRSAARAGAAGTSTPRTAPHRPEDPPAPEPGGGDGRLVVIARRSAARRGAGGCGAARPAGRSPTRRSAEGEACPRWSSTAAALEPEDGRAARAAPQVVLCDEAPLAELDPAGSAVGFFAAVRSAGLVELTRSPTTSGAAARRRGGVLRVARPPRRVGRRRARPRARADRLPARQRGVLRARRGRRRARRTSTPAWSSGSTTRAARSRGATRSARPRCSASSTGSARSTARSATAPRPRCCRAVRDGRRARRRRARRRRADGRAALLPRCRSARRCAPPPFRRRRGGRGAPPAASAAAPRLAVTLPGDAGRRVRLTARPDRRRAAERRPTCSPPRTARAAPRGAYVARAAARASPARCASTGCCSTRAQPARRAAGPGADPLDATRLARRDRRPG